MGAATSQHRLAARVAAVLFAAGLLTLVGASRPQSLVADDRPLASLDATHSVELVYPTPDEADADVSLPAVVSPGRTPRTIEMEVTAYCACVRCCGPNAQGLTASGRDVSYNAGRFVAADTRLLPFGTKLSIPGYHDGIAVEVIDRGGAIKGRKLDVYFPSHEEARQWGRQTLQVTVLD
jgi:3D (Asp-Asp-Asp) domain-containing protein